MIRNLKTLGLTLVAAFALSAMAASVASAQTAGHITTPGPVTLNIAETGVGTANALTSFGGTVTCPGSSYTGHKVLTHVETTAGAKHGFITSGATTATITPHYKDGPLGNCRSNPGNFPTTVLTNGCDYVLHSGVTTGGVEGTYGVTADVVCPANAKIEIQAFSSTSGVLRVCLTKVGDEDALGNPLNQGLTGPHLTNQAGGHVGILGTFHSIHVERSGLCAGGVTTTKEGEFHIDATISAKDEEGAPASISISD
jgi:hypothetical protein